MLSLTIKSIRAKKLRFVLTGVAVMLGVAFMAGTLVLTDTIKQSYDDVASNVYKSTDAVVRSARHVSGDNGAADVRGTVDASVLARVRAARDVAAAEARQTGVAVVVGRDGRLVDANPGRAIPIALGWPRTPRLNPMAIVSGHAPLAANEVVIDRDTQRKGHFVVGERVRVIGPTGARTYTLAGVVTYGGAGSAAGAQVVAFSPETAATVFGTPGRYPAIQVVARPGVSQTELVASLKAALPDRAIEVITGAQAANEARNTTGRSLQFVDMFLLTFAIVALVVGSFVIYNTFSITVAQRTKETALLRAIGARRRQVTRSVMLEALCTGMFASVIGVVAGIGLAQGLRWVLETFGLSLPAAATVIAERTVVMSLIVGVAVTLLAAYLPARRAAKVKPIEALRDASVESRGIKRRSVLGALVTTAGMAAMVQGLSGAGPGAVGIGALGAFIGVAMLGPALARPLTRVFGWPVAHLRGTAGRLARENAARNPRRTAATASALMVGVGLVSMMTVFAASAKTSLGGTIDTGMKGQYIAHTDPGMGGLSPSVARRIAALPEVEAVTPLRYASATVGHSTENITAFDPATFGSTVRADVRSGSFRGLDAHAIAVQADEAKRAHLRVGDRVSVTFPETGTETMRIVAVYGLRQLLGTYAISLPAFDAHVATHVDNDVVIATAKGVSMSRARQAITNVLADYPTARLYTRDGIKGVVIDQINATLNLVDVLLALALVIAFFGIANTLALSVFERTHEFGLLRAVGMGRRQVGATVRWESVLIALVGTSLGTAIGLGFSWALVRAMHDQGVTALDIPVMQLAGIAAFAAVCAVVAAALPARRAARLNVLDAISA